ncbi:MAG: PEP-CTERM sorting domain-containing protein, partial [Proteobacteria bacterium]|nr:PEP-CTERM sorting domain-containing protein [Pseudomonadota bacterium]
GRQLGIKLNNWGTTQVDFDFVTLDVSALNLSPIPEPATMLLLGSGLIGLARFRRKNKEIKL